MDRSGMKNINLETRPDPEQLLAKIKSENDLKSKGMLKIFFGYAAGVGKTYAMLDAAHVIKKSGIDVVVGYIEPHTRPETLALLDGLEVLETKDIFYRGIYIKEFDLEAALKRRPEAMLVDELAHTNAPGSKYKKRWQDIYELLDAGIDVYTTVNVQHIESLNDIVASITNVFVKETIPDKVFDEAGQVEIIDIEPEDLLKRFEAGKVYRKDQAKRAQNNFFQKENLVALREIALRRTADRVNKEVEIARLSKKNVKILPTKELLLGCISPSPASAKVVRTAARMADSLQAKWIAAYVQTSEDKYMDKKIQEQLQKNMALAEQLGAEVVKLHGDDIVEQLVNYGNLRNVTKIVIGRNQKPKNALFNIFKKDIVNRLLDLTLYIDVHVIPGTPQDYQNRKRTTNKNADLLLKFTFSKIDFLKIIGVLCLATALAYAFYAVGFAEANIIMAYIVGVLVMTLITKGYLMGMIGSVLSVLAFNYFFTEPIFTFSAYDAGYLVTFPIMLSVALFTSTLTSRIQHQMVTSLKREEYTQMLYDITRSFLNVSSRKSIVVKGIEYLTSILKRDIIVYLSDEDDNLMEPILNTQGKRTQDLLDKNEEAVVNWVFKNGKNAGVGTDTLPGSVAYYVPIKTHQNIMGVIGVKCCDEMLDIDQRHFLESVTAQMAIALERERLTEQQEETKIEIEREKLRSNLLRAISHDLRSPLAGIAGATTTIIENKETLDQETMNELLNGIYEDSEWLTRLVENLLSMTRIDEGKLQLRKTPEMVEEIISEAIQHVKKRAKEHVIKVKIPEDIFIVPMDGKLIEQVLINLIDNAIKYTPKGTTIEIKAFTAEESAYMEVSDNGEGLPQDSIKHIFDRFYTLENGSKDSRRGIGLGLAICKSIVEAHGGEIEAQNKKEGGALFRFSLPLN
ncbi:two-component system sensor histidine kinase KdpD [Anaerosolibacter carboniphilus]|uniref:histidine kinase n=1 Tax=Anaerosolibacter carboniphilus TaxID=1417629 RepID=A0A841KVF9_9FIRM|nr:sensor histidine kinase KdpD [Anaerosolibacter carboniphilus]MBB6214179.1 two-component system sensor histidine kinase KdpD [Anaerosolibacter carboniphilus]